MHAVSRRFDAGFVTCNRAASTVLPEDLCDTLKFGSLCGLGDFTPYPLTNALTHFPDDFGAPPRLQAAE